MLTSATAKRSNGVLRSFPAEAGIAPPAPHRWRSRLIPVLAVLAVVLFGLFIAITQSRKQETVRDLPPPARAQIFRQSLTEVRSICLESYAARGALHDHCIEEAQFVLLFPECDPGCRATASAVLPHAHR
jgi:cytochrome b pre-mRNA-processing protein 3